MPGNVVVIDKNNINTKHAHIDAQLFGLRLNFFILNMLT